MAAPDGSEESWPIVARSALNGEELATLQLSPSSTVAELVQSLRAAVPNLGALKILAGSRALEAWEQLQSAGLSNGSTVEVVRLPMPAAFVKLGSVDLPGYHCHDTHMYRVSGEDPNDFFVVWARGFRGTDYDTHVAAIRSGKRDLPGPYCKEVILLNLKYFSRPFTADQMRAAVNMQFKELLLPQQERGKHHDKGLWQKAERPDDVYLEDYDASEFETSPVTGGVQRVTMTDAATPPGFYSGVLAVESSGCVLWNVQTVNEDKSDKLERLDLHTGARETVHIVEGEPWLMKAAAFVHGSLFVLGVAAGDDAFCLVAAELIREASGNYREVRRSALEMPAGMQEGAGYSPLSVTADAAGKLLWFGFREPSCIGVLSLDSFQVSRAFEWGSLKPELPRPPGQVWHWQPDPVTGDVYMFWDRSADAYLTDEGPPCSVYCMAASVGVNAVTYSDIPGQQACTVGFGIDGFSDSFCITVNTYVPKLDAFLVLDACAGLWMMPLRYVRQPR